MQSSEPSPGRGAADLLIFANVVAGAVGSGFRDEFNLPNVESTTANDILEAEYGGQGAGQTGTIVFRAEQGVDKPEVRRAMQARFDRVAQDWPPSP